MKAGVFMQVVIFAGGKGVRMSELTRDTPKPLVQIGDVPIIMYVMDLYARQGHCDFVICAGYRYEKMYSYFDERGNLNPNGSFELQSVSGCPIVVRLCDTGLDVQTTTRLTRVAPYVQDQNFFLTYADALADLELGKLIRQHETSGDTVTITAVEKVDNFGVIETLDGKKVNAFYEKSARRLINGGFMICHMSVFDMLPAEDLSFEHAVLTPLAQQGKLGMCRHAGFWKCMDTLADKEQFEELLRSGKAPWYNRMV